MQRSKRLIDVGEVVFASVVSIVWLPNKVYRINLEYTFRGRLYKKPMNGPKSEAKNMESLSQVLIVVDPDFPTSINYLHQFTSTSDEMRRVFYGKSGLSAE